MSLLSRSLASPLSHALARVTLSGAVVACGSSSLPSHAAGPNVSGASGVDSSAPPTSSKPPPKPPSPGSVTTKEPGGDAADPQQAALLRQLTESWGGRADKDDQVVVPLPDFEHWKRVRYWGVEHFVGFRYGNEHHLLAIGFVQDIPDGTPVTSDACMRRFEAWGRPQTKPFDVKFGPFAVHHQRWRNQRLEVHAVDGEFAAGFSKTEFSAAWAAYPAYTNGCFIYAVAVPWRDNPELARQVRDRWVKEGFALTDAKTPERASRK